VVWERDFEVVDLTFEVATLFCGADSCVDDPFAFFWGTFDVWDFIESLSSWRHETFDLSGVRPLSESPIRHPDDFFDDVTSDELWTVIHDFTDG
jgi:hypothetical protein